MFDNTVGKTSSRSESFGKKTKKKVNREILDLKTFQTQADNGFDVLTTLSKKLLEEAEKNKNEKKQFKN